MSNFSLFVKNPKHSFGPNIRSFGFLSYFQVLLNLVSNNLAGSVQRSQLLRVLGIEVVILVQLVIFCRAHEDDAFEVRLPNVVDSRRKVMLDIGPQLLGGES